MPTGYTATLMEQGESFQSFVLHCARAFGALIDMRYDAMDAEIPQFEPSPHYAESLAKHRAALAELQVMSEAERIAYGEAQKAKSLAEHEKWLAEDIEQNERLETMRLAVLAWKPPSKDHEELRKFMLQQINVSFNGLSYIQGKISEAKSKPVDRYWSDAVAAELRGIEYSLEQQAKEIERVRDRNLWVKQLRESLVEVKA